MDIFPHATAVAGENTPTAQCSYIERNLMEPSAQRNAHFQSNTPLFHGDYRKKAFQDDDFAGK